MTKKGVRIISLEASEIYGKILKNGEDIGYSLPKKKDYTLFKLFKNVLDYSLDLVELEKIYEDKCRRKFLFPDKSGYDYTYAVINVKFNYIYLSIGCTLNLKQLRQYFYENGFNVDGVHYVRYKRSSGSSREGKCLFIDERLYKHMSKWGECGLKNTADIASWEAYKSLSLSSLKGLINIPLDGILYLNDYESSFSEEVISIEEENGKLIAEKKFANINNNIWDGESLLDERMFTGEYKDRHMLLLRNKFFKSCAFKTRLQKWFKDKGISSVEQLKERGFVTMATDISQIVMVTTTSSMKFLKFLKGGLNEINVRKWSENVDCNFGVVKYDKRTKFFNGKMVQTSYQFINTLGLNEETAEQLLKPSIDYISSIRQDYDLMRYHFTDGIRREIDGDDAEISDGLAERCDVIFRLMNLNYGFKETRLYKHFRDDVVENLKKKLKVGKILLSGTNATLFGNGPEMLMAISGEFDVNVKYNESLVLSRGEIACFRFEHGRKLACARSPHITMGNLYYATNNVRNDIWNYFDLGDNVVCVNAIEENIQQRLNGCDYDSDTMLITDEPFVVNELAKQDGKFLVPVCNIESAYNHNQTLADLDYATSKNKIGQIVNLSQKLNSVLWHNLNSETPNQEEVDKIYLDICILAVLSGIEIDKAKRAYQNVNVFAELDRIVKLYGKDRPNFFKTLDSTEIERKISSEKDEVKREELRLELEKHYTVYNTAMEYVYNIANAVDFRQGKKRRARYMRIIEMIKEPSRDYTSSVYGQRDTIIELNEEYKNTLNGLYKSLKLASSDEKEIIYSKIVETKKERDNVINGLLCNEYLMYIVLKHYDTGKGENWYLYAPILESDLFVRMLKNSEEILKVVSPSVNGKIVLYGENYTKN